MKFLFSSLGKKIQVAVTGIFLSVFLVFHLINNLVLFTGKDNFNQMVGLLESIKPLIRVMEAGLLLVVAIHVFNAVYLALSNKKAATTRYSVDASATSSLNSRTMIVSGATILIFFIIHLKYIWYILLMVFLSETEKSLLFNPTEFIPLKFSGLSAAKINGGTS